MGSTVCHPGLRAELLLQLTFRPADQPGCDAARAQRQRIEPALVTLDGVPPTDPFGGWISYSAIDPERLGTFA